MKLLATLLLLPLPAVVAHAEEAPDLRITVVVPFSSSIQAVAQDALNGAALGAQAGIDRLKGDRPRAKFNVKLIFFDDRGSHETAETIVSSGQYGAVVGGVNSGTAIPAAPIH